MKKILFVITSLSEPSAEGCIRLCHVFSLHYDVTLCAVFSEDGLYRTVHPRVQYITLLKKGNPRTCNRLMRIPSRALHSLLIRESYDAEIAIDGALSAHLVAGSDAFRILYLWQDVRFAKELCDRRSHNRYGAFDRIVCASRSAMYGYYAIFGVARRLRVAYPPVQQSRLQYLAKEPYLCDIPYFTSVVRDRDDMVCLIEAVALLRNEFPSFHTVCILPQDRVREMERMISHFGLEAFFTLVCDAQNPYPILTASHGLILPARHKNTGVLLCDAMACGIPVFAMRCGVAEEIIREPRQGFLCAMTGMTLAQNLAHFMRGESVFDPPTAIQRANTFSSLRCLHAFVG